MALVEIRKAKCLLCGRSLTSFGDGFQKHPTVDDCLVRWTDTWGVAVEHAQVDEKLVEDEGFVVEGMLMFPPVDEVCTKIFAKYGTRRLGGISSGRGWSSVSLYQRCPYAWKRRYLDSKRSFGIKGVESPALAVGTLVHTFLALYYQRMIDQNYPIDPQLMLTELTAEANPQLVNEGWRVFRAYAILYQHENILPLAIEHDLRDPRTNESCRYDLIAYFPEDEPGSDRRRDGIAPGTYNVEHKTYSRADYPTINGWANDGEVIGQMTLWQKLSLEKRFGPLRGTIVNLVGKQKDPQMYRTYVAESSWQIEQHQADLRSWEAQIKLSMASGEFRRARGNCINRYGLCDNFDHCATGES